MMPLEHTRMISTNIGHSNIGKRNMIEDQTTPQRFREICLDYFFSTQVTKDLRIDNSEVEFFFTFLCREIQNPYCKDSKFKFVALPIDIQLEFLNLICPPGQITNGMNYQQCSSKMLDDVKSSRIIAYKIPTQTTQSFREIGNFCNALYPKSTDFHYGTFAPSPTISPTISFSPTIKTFSPKPTATRTQPPSASPTISPRPTTTSSPSSVPSKSIHPTPTVTSEPTLSPRPTSLFEFQRSFTYKMAFDNPDVHTGVLQNNRADIMDSTSTAIVTMLTVKSPNIVDPSSLRPVGMLTFSTSSSTENGVEHLLRRNEPCEPDFPSSYRCVAIVTEVSLESSTNISPQVVSDAVFLSLRGSMGDNSFMNAGVHNQVKGVKYMNDGGYILPNQDTGLSNGAIAGIVIGCLLFGLLIALAFFTGVVRAKDEDDSSISSNDQSLSSEDNYMDNVTSIQGRGVMDDDDDDEDNFSQMKDSVGIDDNSYIDVLEKFQDDQDEIDSEYFQSISTRSYSIS